MRGQLLVVPPDAPEEKYFAVALRVEDGRELRFHDMWTWGEMRLMTADELAAHPALAQMGPEPFSPRVDAAGLCRNRSPAAGATAIKAALLDQTVVAGVGNIYADEACFVPASAPCAPPGR